MKKLFILFVLCLFFWTVCKAQSAINGMIKDETGKAVSSATVFLLRASDTSTIKFTVSDKDGQYNFPEIPQGKYFISVISVGFDTAYSSTFNLGKKDATIEPIILHNRKNALKDVTVSVSRPFIEMHLDKMLINVEASPTNAGANVLEVLAKSPMINVDIDENISLNGKKDVLILVDGKKTYLSGKDLASFLKSMPAADIDQIEIMTNPPAKYDAEGMGGIINIKTKKTRQDGWNGTISTNGQLNIFSVNEKTYLNFGSQNNLNFNYKKGKINIFGSAGYSYYSGRDSASYYKTYYTPEYIVNGYSFFYFNGKYGGHYVPLNAGLDYYINKKNTVGISIDQTLGSGEQDVDRTTDLWDENHEPLQHYESLARDEYNFYRTAVNLNWKHTIDTLGQEISFDADYIYGGAPNNDTLKNNYSDNTTSLLSSNANDYTNIVAFQSDYTKPFKNGRIDAGVKFSSVQTKLNNLFYNYADDEWIKNESFTNHSSYNENINAAYINANKQIKKWSFQAGLRLENMNMHASQTLNDYKTSRTNTGLFPSFFTEYDIDKNNTVKISASRRINRYSFYQIMPYLNVADSLDIWHGNPNLKPEHAIVMELDYAFKNKYFITFSYTIRNDAIWYVAAQIGEDKITEFYPENIDKLDNISLNITTPIKVTRWWEINLFTNVYSNKFYNLNNNTVSKFYFTLNENMSNTFKLGKGLKGELLINYTTKSVDQLGETLPKMNDFSIALQKQILKEKGNLTLNISDPFQWCYHRRFNGTFLRMDEKDHNYWNTRFVSMTFNYRFGKVNNQRRQHSIASQEEQNR